MHVNLNKLNSRLNTEKFECLKNINKNDTQAAPSDFRIKKAKFLFCGDGGGDDIYSRLP